MNISLQWLKDIAPTLTGSAREVADTLTQTAVPVDEVIPLAAGLEPIVVGRVVGVREHPNADRLVICDVEIGGEAVQVVTGAPNVVEGAFYPFVGAGMTLPNGQRIEEVELRGELSQGMLCSERELGLGRDQAGVMRLRGDFEPGEPLVEALGRNDHRLVLDVTPNRPDLLGHLGVAREVAPGGVHDLQLPEFPGQRRASYETDRRAREGETGGVTVRIEDPEACPRYMGLVVRGVSVGPSPEWLASRLRAIGLQPINNVVDATNCVLHELNQPLHPFDLAELDGPAVIVRRADKGETLRTLDGQDRELDPEILVIADDERACALAGVMGGEDTEVGPGTTDIFIECACFQPRRVRRARQRFNLDTDAAYRFERGIDPDGLPAALARVTDLIMTVAGGTPAPRAVDICPDPPARRLARLRPARVEQVLGQAIGHELIRECLEPLGFELDETEPGELSVRIPTWRPDVEREVDLIEEVARRYGYERFPQELRQQRPAGVGRDPLVPTFDRLRDFFVRLGFYEARTSPLTDADRGDVSLLNPLSEREANLRRSVLPGLVRVVETNFARGERDVRVFDIGTAFLGSGDGAPMESLRIAAAWTGHREPPHWSEADRDWDVWDLKWIFEQTAELATHGADVRPTELAGGDGRLPFDHAFAAVDGEGQTLGWAGRVRTEDVDAPAWAAPVWGFELEIRSPKPEKVTFRPLPIYPAVDRDLALLVPKGVMAAEVEAEIEAAAPELLESLDLFDVYEGERIPQGIRSIAWRLRFRAPDRTLTDQEVDGAVEKITAALEEGLDVRVRGP